MGRQQGRGGMGSHKHGVSGRPGPSAAVKRATAEVFEREAEAQRRRRRLRRTYGSVRAALRGHEPR